MTCHQVLSLLDDYVDDDVTAADGETIRLHLDGCDACRAEYESLLQLKDVLAQRPEPDPGPQYWDEVTRLVLARTAESPPMPGREQYRERPNRDRIAFTRSLVSAAASVIILLAALFLGSGEHYRAAAVVAGEQTVFLSPSLAGRFPADENGLITLEERLRLARGVFLLGAPGIHSRFTGIPGLMAFD